MTNDSCTLVGILSAAFVSGGRGGGGMVTVADKKAVS